MRRLPQEERHPLRELRAPKEEACRSAIKQRWVLQGVREAVEVKPEGGRKEEPPLLDRTGQDYSLSPSGLVYSAKVLYSAR